MKVWIILVGATVLGIALYWLIRIDGESVSPPASHASVAPSPEQVGATRYAAARRLPLPLGATADAAGTARTATDGIEPANAKPPPSIAEVRDRVEVFFRAEAVDPSWSQGAAETLTRAIQAMLPAGSRLQRAECRETICRIETSHLDVDEFRAYARGAFLDGERQVSHGGFFASVLGDPTAGGPVVAVAYLAREGKDLPNPESLLATQ